MIPRSSALHVFAGYISGEVLRGDRIVNTPYEVRFVLPLLTSGLVCLFFSFTVMGFLICIKALCCFVCLFCIALFLFCFVCSCWFLVNSRL